MKFIILLLSFFLSYGVAIIAADQKISSRALSFKNNDEDRDQVEALTKEIQNLLGRIEVLEHTVSNLQSKATKSDDAPKDIDQASTNNNIEDDVFEVPTLMVAPAPVKIEQETNVKKVNNEKQTYDQAIIALKDAKSDAPKLIIAEQKFADFIKNFPNSQLQSNAYFWHGETFFRRKIFKSAAISYLKGYKQFPKGDKASDSLLKLALSLGYSNRKKDACEMISKLEAEFPNRPVDSIKKTKDARVEFGCQLKTKS